MIRIRTIATCVWLELLRRKDVYVLLILMPGAWLSFLPDLNKMNFYIRILFAIVFSPIVIFIQFYLIRITGLNFEQAIIGIILLKSRKVQVL